MFDTLPETRQRKAILGPGSVSTALFFHGALIAILVLATLLPKVEAGDDPMIPIEGPLVIVSESPRLGNDELGGGPLRHQSTPEKPASEPESQIVQPRLEPEAPLSSPPDPEEAERTQPVDASEPTTEGDGPASEKGGTGTGSGEGPGSGVQGVPWGKPDGKGFRTGGDGGAPDPDKPLIIDGSIQEPVPLLRVQPEYPEMARRAHIEGVVVLQTVIGSDGSVESVQVLKSLPLLEEAAVKAVRQWRYLPARQGGRPVKVYYIVRVEFSLR